MNKKEEYLSDIEKKLFYGMIPLEKDLCDDFAQLSISDQIVYRKAFEFAGCKQLPNIPNTSDWILTDEDRLRGSRFLLLSLYVGTGEPRWSSWLIDQMWSAILGIQGGRVSDLYESLFLLIREVDYSLDKNIAGFIKALTYNGRMRFLPQYSAKYSMDKFGWSKNIQGENILPVQAYLLTYCLPLELFSPELSVMILRAIEGSIFWKEVIGWLYDTLHDSKTTPFLADWYKLGISQPFDQDIDSIIKNSRDI